MMSNDLLDAFFTVLDEGGGPVGFAVGNGRVADWRWGADPPVDRSGVPLAERWPQLPAAFRDGFDAVVAVPADNPWAWVFRGDMCLRLQPFTGAVGQVVRIEDALPGLPSAMRSGIDAALPVAGGAELFLFRGDQCVRYDVRSMDVVESGSLREMFSGLGEHAAGMVGGISAAVHDPGTGRFFFFKADKFTEGVLSERRVDTPASKVDYTAWPGLNPALRSGRLFVQFMGITPNIRVTDPDAGVELYGLEPVQASTQMSRPMSVSRDGRYLYLADRRNWPSNLRAMMDLATGAVLGPRDSEWLYAPEVFTRDGRTGYATGFFTDSAFPRGRYLVEHPPGRLDATPVVGLDSSALDEEPALAAEEGGGGETANTHAYCPVFFTLSPDERFAYVNGALSTEDGLLLEVDLAGKRITRRFHIPGSGQVKEVVIAPDGSTAHVLANLETLNIDLGSGALVRPNTLPRLGYMLALTRDGSALYHLDREVKKPVLVVDPATHRVMHEIRSADDDSYFMRGIEFDYFGRYAYISVSCVRGSYVAVVDTTTHQQVRSFPVGRQGYGEWGPRTLVYVASDGSWSWPS